MVLIKRPMAVIGSVNVSKWHSIKLFATEFVSLSSCLVVFVALAQVKVLLIVVIIIIYY